MKISQKQAFLLAKEIVRQLKEKKAQKCPDHIRKGVEQFVSKRDELTDKKQKAQDEITKHDRTLYTIVGRSTNISAYDNVKSMIEKIEEKSIPSVSSIEDEIVLKSMFQNEEDMETFVSTIVKKYEKKLQSRILSN
jgi:hypothetical protein